MKKPLLYLIAVLGSFAGQAQVISNDSMEHWTPSGKPAPFNWEEPTGWKTNNASVEFSSASVRKSTSAKSGTLAASIKTSNVFGTHYAGTLALGNADVDYPKYTVKPLTGGMKVDNPPVMLRGYYKFSSTTTGDSAFVVAIIKSRDSLDNTVIDTFKYGSVRLGPAANYTQFELSISQQPANAGKSDSLVVVFYSSDPDSASEGGELIVDDLQLIYFGVGIPKITIDGFEAYPNPAGEKLHVAIPDECKNPKVEMFTVTGELVLTQNVSHLNDSIEISHLEPGIYYAMLTSESGLRTTQKIVKR